MSKKYKKRKLKSAKPIKPTNSNTVLAVEVRSMKSFSTDITYSEPGNWTTVAKATEEGLKKNPWVYRSIVSISSLMSSVEWAVYNKDDKKKIKGHYLGNLIENPNPKTSRQTMIETMSKWLQLVGNSYLYKTVSNDRTAQLWLVNPDLLEPIPGKNIVADPIIGYKKTNQTDGRQETFEFDEIIRHYFVDPSDPAKAISPTQALSKAIDTDVAAENFNYNTMKNRGVIDGVFTFDREFSDLDSTKDLAAQIEEKYGQKRGFIVLSQNAKYTRVAITPAEMDFTESRKWNRDEISAVYGMPLPLVSGDNMTYNNYDSAMAIFWEQTIIPSLDDLADTFNTSFKTELASDKLVIGYDLSKVEALQKKILEKAETAKKFSEMGVPFKFINTKFGFGIPEYPGWDQPISQSKTSDTNIDTTKDKKEPTKDDKEDRSICPYHEIRQTAFSKTMNQQIDQDTDTVAPEMVDIYDKWKSEALDAIVAKDKARVRKLSKKYKDIINPIYKENFFKYGMDYGLDEYRLQESKRNFTGFETRETDAEKEEKILGYLEPMYKTFEDVDSIAKVRQERVFELIAKSIVGEWSLKDTTNALIDTGLFSPEQALRNSRTWIGTAASSGRHSGAKAVDADAKEWMSSGDKNTRRTHKNANGQAKPVDEFFTVGGERGMYPLDSRFSSKERLN